MSNRYTTPESGTLDWHVPLNENFELLDTDVEIRDKEENIAEYSPDAGAKFFATDTGRRYVGDGSTWVKAPLSVPSLSSDTSSPVDGQVWLNETEETLKMSTTDGSIDIV